MKKLYVVYECDKYRQYSSSVIKFVTSSKSVAVSLFNKGKKHYTDESYFLNVSEYTPVINTECDNNFLRNLDEPFLTTEKQ